MSYVEVDGDRFAYRRWGKPSGVPIFLVQHFRGGGIASSSGTPRNRMEDMADDIAAVIRALGLEQVDLLGFSIGGWQAEEVALRHPQLVRKLLLIGTGLRGGDPTMDPKVPEVALNPVPGLEDFLFLFFGRSEAAVEAGRAFWKRKVYAAVRDVASITDPRLTPVALDVTDPAAVRSSSCRTNSRPRPRFTPVTRAIRPPS
ncbi:alpha/beta fold hydrolase [Streptomyces sp. SAS_270]|uniref:alpha/beta fold hydrolase n=1 Tax=Streptomyces sp. SAS_270 TaxID=3412748 RepID=UPI00403C56B3